MRVRLKLISNGKNYSILWNNYVRVQERDVKIAILDSKIKNNKHSSVYFSALNSFSIVPNTGVFPK